VVGVFAGRYTRICTRVILNIFFCWIIHR
jgi:hypothetical protein